MQQIKKSQSHGMTHQQHRDLQYAQTNDEQEFVNANKNSDVQIPENEQHLVHANIEVPIWNEGTKISKPRLQSFTVKDFKQMENENAFAGQSVEIVHMPEVDDRGKKVEGVLTTVDKKGAKAPKDLSPEEQELLRKKNEVKLIKGMKLDDLKVKYKELWNDEAPADAKKADLIDPILEKLGLVEEDPE